MQSLATQHFLLEWLFSLNDKQEKTLNLMQRLRALRIKIIEDAHISTTARFSNQCTFITYKRYAFEQAGKETLAFTSNSSR